MSKHIELVELGLNRLQSQQGVAHSHSFIHVFICSYIHQRKYSLGTCDVPGTLLAVGVMSVNKTEKNLLLCGTYIPYMTKLQDQLTQ